jgi:hypothetical protein
MKSFTGLAYVVSALSAFLACGFELGNEYRRSPFCSMGFGLRWLSITLLDALAGLMAISLCSAMKLAQHYAWLNSWYGWIVIGLSAALMMRANLGPIDFGNRKVPLGTGVFYAAARKIFETPLKDLDWKIGYAIKQGRLQWSLAKIDSVSGELLTTTAVAAVRDYVHQNIVPDNGDRVREELDLEIGAALDNPDQIDQIKQLVTFMIAKGYISPLESLLGTPTRKEMKSWRSRSIIASMPTVV